MRLSVKVGAKVVPKRLAEKIKKRLPDISSLISSPPPSRGRTKVEVLLNTNDLRLTTNPSGNTQPETRNPKPVTILEIDIHRPDRIIFEGEKIEVTSKEFSLIYLLTQHPEQVMSYDEILDELWKDEEDAIYNRVSYHFSKIRSTILKTIGKSKRNKERVKDILKVISRRGIMLNLAEDQLKIN